MRVLVLLIPLLCLSLLLQGQDRWQDISKKGKGQITFYWYPNNIEITESKDILDGIEYDLSASFVNYLNKKYNVQIKHKWIETKSFIEVMDIVRTSKNGIFGASSFSITEERKKEMNFSPPYLADVAVLVSNSKIPLALTAEEFKEVFQGKTAITIDRTTLKESILRLEDELGLDFEEVFVSNSGEIIDKIISNEDGFGYIDLPNFLIPLNHNAKVRRQFFHPYKLEGLAFIYPLNSDWEEPVNDYFNSDQFAIDRNEIIGKYLGTEVTATIDRIAKSAEIGPLEEIAISHREKELQYKALLDSAKKDQGQLRTTILLILVVVFTVIILLFLFFRYRIKLKANEMLIEKQAMIEQRNMLLQTLNQEKNDLIHILAHDLRSPLTHISGIADIFKSREDLPEDVKELNDFTVEASKKMTNMIAKILDSDAIDSGKRNINMESFDVNEIIESAYKEHLSKAEAKKIRLSKELGNGVIAHADRFYTHQILENLITNAIKYSDSGTHVTVSSLRRGGQIRLLVKDQGPGFSSEDEQKLFRKYQMLSAKPTAGEHSMGLGLHIVKQYTELMGGTITYKTEVGNGTSFFVDLKKG